MHKLNSSDIILILANFVPIIGVLFWDWSLFSMLIGYWVETGVIVIYTFAKIVYTLKISSPTQYTLLGTINAFGVIAISFGNILVCGIFMFAHLVFIVGASSVFPDWNGLTGFDLLRSSLPNMITMFTVLMISHGYSFFYNFIKGGEAQNIKLSIAENPSINLMLSINNILGSLIKRITFTHFVLLIGFFIIILTKSPPYMAIFFILLKTWLDLGFHKKKHAQTIPGY